MKKWGIRCQRLASLVAVAALLVALPGCGGGSSGGGGGTSPVTASFTPLATSCATDTVCIRSATCTNDVCNLEIAIGATTASNFYAFAFDLEIGNTAVAQLPMPGATAGPFLTCPAPACSGIQALASQNSGSNRIVVGVSKSGAVPGNGTGSEALVVTVPVQAIGVGDSTISFAGSPANPVLGGNCSASGPEAIDDQNPPNGDCIFGLTWQGGTLSGS